LPVRALYHLETLGTYTSGREYYLSGIHHHIDQYIFSGVLELHTASIFRAEEYIKQVASKQH
jgi:hypothetical protein